KGNRQTRVGLHQQSEGEVEPEIVDVVAAGDGQEVGRHIGEEGGAAEVEPRPADSDVPELSELDRTDPASDEGDRGGDRRLDEDSDASQEPVRVTRPVAAVLTNPLVTEVQAPAVALFARNPD